MARNTVPLSQVIDDFILTIADDDYAGRHLTHKSERMLFVVFESLALICLRLSGL